MPCIFRPASKFWLLRVFLLASTHAMAFAPQYPATRSLQQQHRMCICIDCAFVTNCTSYHFVEAKHSQPHMTDDPTFTPVDGSPTIHVNIRTQAADPQEVKRLWSEHSAETAKVEARRNQDDDASSVGEETYDLSSTTTIEYDVVKCESFVEEKGCWIKNMPEEIRIANPDFVPT